MTSLNVTDKSVDILFALLRAGLNTDHNDPTDFEYCDATCWQSIYALALRQGVLAIAWDGLQRLISEGKIPAERQPDRSVRIVWACNVDRTEKIYAKQRSAITALAGFYAVHDIRMMVLKGYGLSLLYPRPEHRPCGDIDIWLYGQQRQADLFLRTECGIEIDGGKHHHTVFQFNGVMVENHYDFLNVHSHTSNREIEKYLKRLTARGGEESVDINGTLIFLPSADFNALFLLRHAAVHFAAAKIALRHVIDWCMFITRYHSAIDWKILEDTAEEQNMHRFMHCMNAIAIDYLGMDQSILPDFERDPELERRVLNDIISPEFSDEQPKKGVIRKICYKFRRWWTNRWKHRIVYKEGLATTLFVQIYSHLLKPKSIMH